MWSREHVNWLLSIWVGPQQVLQNKAKETCVVSSPCTMPSTQLIKQIAAGRRRPNLTRKEYFDHRFRIHGEISDAIEDKNQKPQ